MIKTEKEYLEAKKRLEHEFKELEKHKAKMKNSGMSDEHIHLGLDPLASFALSLKEEIEEYEKLQRGQFEVIENLNGLGRMLVALRIFKGMKQKDLADVLGVSEAQVSRDERNEYHGASIEKIQRILNALGVVLKSELDTPLKDAV